MLGRVCRASPQFMRKMQESWSGLSVFIDRMTQRSSTHSARWGKISLTSMPLRPCFRNAKGDGKTAPKLPGRGCSMDISRPAYFASAGLGSNVSICPGPPLAKSWSTRRAFGAKWGRRGSSGFRTAASCPSASDPALASRSAIASAPNPTPARVSHSRRESGRESLMILSSIDEDKLVRFQQDLGVLLPRSERCLGGPREIRLGAPGALAHPDLRSPSEPVVRDVVQAVGDEIEGVALLDVETLDRRRHLAGPDRLRQERPLAGRGD